MPIVSNYTIARRRQPDHLGCVRPTGRFRSVMDVLMDDVLMDDLVELDADAYIRNRLTEAER